MNIRFIYREKIFLTESEKEFIFREAKRFGTVEIKTFTTKFGSSDLVSIIETTLTFMVLTSIQAFAKGFFGEDWLKNLGQSTRNELVSEIIRAQSFIKAYYEVFVKNKKNKQEAFLISESIGEVTLYVVINHFKMSERLLDKLPQALVDTYGKISLGYIHVESNTCQLFPDFENDEWRYLFNPTYQGFGNFVDKYFDLRENRQYKINSKSEFINRFNLISEDKYKLIINPLLER